MVDETKNILKSKLQFIRVYHLLVAAIIAVGFGAWLFSTSPQHIPSKHANSSGTLIFDDEFNGPSGSSPSASNWQILGGSDPERWGEECFVNDNKHVYLNGTGQLVLTATYNPNGVPCNNGSGPYESGGITTGSATGGLFDFKYGIVEASILVPCQSGTGMWPAFWSDGPNWPTGGEIDYLEIMDGLGPDNAKQSLHGPTTGGSYWNIGNNNIASSPWCGAYHTYGAIWSPGEIQFTIDGSVKFTDTPSNMKTGWIWPFDNYQQRILLDLQVGDSGGTVNNSTLPQSMLVDYVRVYSYNNPPPPSIPSISITSPSNNATVSNTIAINANASDSGATITKVDFYVDNNDVSSTSTSPYSYNLDTTKYLNGNHSIYAVAFNNAGESGTSSTITINVQNNNSGGGGGSGSGNPPGGSSNPPATNSSGSNSVIVTTGGNVPAVVSVDGQKASTSVNTTQLTNGKHVISITADGKTKTLVVYVHNSWERNLLNHLAMHPVLYSSSSFLIIAIILLLVFRRVISRWLYNRFHKKSADNNEFTDIHVG